MKTFAIRTSLALCVLAGCASTTPAPQELVSARVAYERARTGDASRHALVELHEAAQALQRAEAAYLDEPSSEDARDLAYVAERRAQLAAARAGVRAANERREAARVAREQLEHQRLQQAQAALEQQQRMLSSQRQQLSQTSQQLDQTQDQLATERQARAEAERQAQAAMESLRRVASVREEQRGTVISLPGEVLFAPGESALLPVAQQRLDEVARTLVSQRAALLGRIRIEGHTDARGSSTDNQQLSAMRAQAVRDYLVSRGVPSDQVEAVGLGESRPMASNDTSEGRATNRRVEIVVPSSAVGGGPRAGDQGTNQGAYHTPGVAIPSGQVVPGPIPRQGAPGAGP